MRSGQEGRSNGGRPHVDATAKRSVVLPPLLLASLLALLALLLAVACRRSGAGRGSSTAATAAARRRLHLLLRLLHINQHAQLASHHGNQTAQRIQT